MDAILIRDAIDQLKLARNNLRQAGAPAALEKVRSALKSAEGAQRHAERMASSATYNETVARPRHERTKKRA